MASHDSGVDIIEMEAPLEGIDDEGSNRRSALQKFQLKSMLTFSTKYMATFDKFAQSIAKDHDQDGAYESGRPIFDRSTLVSSLSRFVSEECDPPIVLPDSVSKVIKQIKYLPRIEDRSCVASQQSPLLSRTNRLYDMNRKCSQWLDRLDPSPDQ